MNTITHMVRYNMATLTMFNANKPTTTYTKEDVYFKMLHANVTFTDSDFLVPLSLSTFSSIRGRIIETHKKLIHEWVPWLEGLEKELGEHSKNIMIAGDFLLMKLTNQDTPIGEYNKRYIDSRIELYVLNDKVAVNTIIRYFTIGGGLHIERPCGIIDVTLPNINNRIIEVIPVSESTPLAKLMLFDMSYVRCCIYQGQILVTYDWLLSMETGLAFAHKELTLARIEKTVKRGYLLPEYDWVNYWTDLYHTVDSHGDRNEHGLTMSVNIDALEKVNPVSLVKVPNKYNTMMDLYYMVIPSTLGNQVLTRPMVLRFSVNATLVEDTPDSSRHLVTEDPMYKRVHTHMMKILYETGLPAGGINTSCTSIVITNSPLVDSLYNVKHSQTQHNTLSTFYIEAYFVATCDPYVTKKFKINYSVYGIN